jgi:glycosyltransferase involved in cell wall biosynthesis
VKIALVTRRYPPLIGGAEKVLSYLAPALAAEGAEVTVLTARLAGLPKRETIPTAAGSLTVVRLPSTRLRFAGTWLYMRNLRRWLDRHPIDLAYVSMLKHDAYVAVGAGRRRGFPVVLRPEGAGATGDLAWQTWGRFGRTIGRRCRSADAIVAISRAIRDELVRNGYDRTTEIIELPNGVPVPADPWRRRDAWRSSPRAVFVGRLAPEKGLDTLIDAWPIVLESYPSARLTLVGDGPERPALEARRDRLGLGSTIEFSGPSDDPTPLLRASDLFVLPSREEGMSIALLEAMALGMPVVASSIPGNRRLVADFRQGRLFPVNNPRLLALTILDQWADFDRAAHMAAAARGLVNQKYAIAAVARQHMDLFRRLVLAKNERRDDLA